MRKTVDRKTAKPGDFVCMCKKPCKDGQCKDPKRVKQAAMVDMEQLRQQTISVAAIAGHEANRVYCQSIGDDSQKPWAEAEPWQRESAIKGVLAVLQSPDLTPAQCHSLWAAEKRAQGWVLGPLKDSRAKVHPCLLPYNDLPEKQRVKDELFTAVVKAVLFGNVAPPGGAPQEESKGDGK